MFYSLERGKSPHGSSLNLMQKVEKKHPNVPQKTPSTPTRH
jgi:hypothetical protein